MSHFEAHVGLLRLSMKGIFNAFGENFIFELVTWWQILIHFLYFLMNLSILFQKQLSQTEEWRLKIRPDFMGASG